MSETVILALGANLGDRAGNLRRAVGMLAGGGVRVTRPSSIWETPPFPAGQPPYLNAAIACETTLDPHALLALAKRIEHTLGRRPGPRWGPRPVDIDILFHGELMLDTPDLVIPHPRISERAFVLAPLAEAWPGPLPVLNLTALHLLANLDTTGVARTAEPLAAA